jgi:hypothetical protein
MTYTSLGTAGEPQEHGKIVASDGWSYQLTPDDLLWLARSVEFEGGTNPSAVIWTYAQRLALPGFRRQYPSLASLVRAHSQPVNPKWARDGVFCKPGGSHAGLPECSEAKLARRDRASTIAWADINAHVRDLVTKFTRAELPNPVPRSVDFADARVSANFLVNNPTARTLLKAGNWFIGTAQSLLWPDGHVSVHYKGAQSGEAPGSGNEGIGVGLVVLALAAAAGVVWWMRSRS